MWDGSLGESNFKTSFDSSPLCFSMFTCIFASAVSERTLLAGIYGLYSLNKPPTCCVSLGGQFNSWSITFSRQECDHIKKFKSTTMSSLFSWFHSSCSQWEKTKTFTRLLPSPISIQWSSLIPAETAIGRHTTASAAPAEPVWTGPDLDVLLYSW